MASKIACPCQDIAGVSSGKSLVLFQYFYWAGTESLKPPEEAGRSHALVPTSFTAPFPHRSKRLTLIVAPLAALDTRSSPFCTCSALSYTVRRSICTAHRRGSKSHGSPFSGLLSVLFLPSTALYRTTPHPVTLVSSRYSVQAVVSSPLFVSHHEEHLSYFPNERVTNIRDGEYLLFLLSAPSYRHTSSTSAGMT